MSQSPIEAMSFEPFLIWGGDGDESDGDAGENQDESEDSGDTGDGPGDDSGDEGDDSGSDDSGNADEEDESEVDKLKRENIRLKQRLDKKADDDKARKKNETVAQRETRKLQERNAKLEGMFNTTFLNAAIASTGKYEWQNIEDVRAFINMDDVHIDLDSGTVEGLDLQLKKIAKNKPYLLKAAKKDDGGEQEPPRRASGQGGQNGTQQRLSADQSRRDQLKAKYLKQGGFVTGVGGPRVG